MRTGNADKESKVAQWRQRMERFAVSGQTVKDFCDAEAVSESTFYRWRGALSRDGIAVGFIDAGALKPVTAPPADEVEEPQVAALEVRLDLGDGLTMHFVRR